MEDRLLRSRAISLVIPAFNEAAGIRQAIVEADEALPRLSADYEILVVDDGSQDGTAQIVAELAATNARVRLLEHKENRGYGAALGTGFRAARFERVAFTDADCQFYLDDLSLLLDLADHHDIAAGYRVDRQDPWQRRFFSWGYNRLVRTLVGTNVRDCDCALKVFRREALEKVLPETSGFFVNTEMLARARQAGLSVAEAGVRHRPRRHGVSKVSLQDIPRTLRTLVPFWWSRVLFPNADASGPSDYQAGAPFRWGFVAIALMAAVLFFLRLGAPLQEPEEPRYAEIARQMLTSNVFVTPVYHGMAYYDKPPLLYWLVMGSYKLFGIQDWTAKLAASTAGFFCILLTYWWGRRVAGPRMAFLSALILLLSARFVYLSRLLTMNGLLCLWVIAALAFGHVAIREGCFKRRWWLLSAVACSLGLLTKGPVALVLVLVPLACFLLLDRRTARLPMYAWPAYFAICAAIAGPWYVTAAVQDPEFLGHFLWKHNLVRFVAPFDHAKPVWTYVPEIMIGLLPWSLLFIPLVRFLAVRTLPAGFRRTGDVGFFLLAAITGFVFFSLAGSKRAGYILPVMPLAALALGSFLNGVWDGLRYSSVRFLNIFGSRRVGDYLIAGTYLAALAGCLLAGWYGILKPNVQLLLMGAILLVGTTLILASRQIKLENVWRNWALSLFVLWSGAVYFMLPGYARKFAMRGQIRPMASLAADSSVPVVSYPRRWDSISFYLKRTDVRVYTAGQARQLVADTLARPETIAFIKSDHSLETVLRELPAWMEFVPSGRQGQVTAGTFRPRSEFPSTFYASRVSAPAEDGPNGVRLAKRASGHTP